MQVLYVASEVAPFAGEGELAESAGTLSRMLARLGLALAWSLNLEEAVRVASEAGERLAAGESDDDAADYLADACEAVWGASFNPLAWRLAEQGLRYTGDRRDFTWVRLCGLDLTRREVEDPDAPGIHLDAPERWELAEVQEHHPQAQEALGRSYLLISVPVSSREELRRRFAGAAQFRSRGRGSRSRIYPRLRICFARYRTFRRLVRLSSRPLVL